MTRAPLTQREEKLLVIHWSTPGLTNFDLVRIYRVSFDVLETLAIDRLGLPERAKAQADMADYAAALAGW